MAENTETTTTTEDKRTPLERAQAKADAAGTKVTKLTERLAKARRAVGELAEKLEQAKAEQAYAEAHPALARARTQQAEATAAADPTSPELSSTEPDTDDLPADVAAAVEGTDADEAVPPAAESKAPVEEEDPFA